MTKSKNNQTWNRRERVRAALERRGADRVPVFMWFHPETARRLARLLEIPAAHVAEAMGDDIRQTWVNNNHAMEGVVHERDGEGHTDLWGIRWQKEGAFNQVVSSPLAGAMPADLARYEFPNDLDALVALMEPVVENRQDFFIGVDVSPCVFELYNRLRGMEMALLDLVAQPDEARALSRR